MTAIKTILVFGITLLLAGCASAQPGNLQKNNPKDPLESINRNIYQFNEVFDKTLLKPAAQGYNAILPEPGRIVLNNFFSNLDDVTVTLNDLLQLKLKQAASDGSRVLFNSTFGILGLLNVADQLEKHNEDFGQTLGYWGIGSGPYLVLPFFGPSSVRDGIGLGGDSLTGVITNLRDVPTRNTLYVTDKVNTRAKLLDREKTLEEASDRYAFIRDYYLARRQNLVYDGNPPREKYIDEED